MKSFRKYLFGVMFLRYFFLSFLTNPEEDDPVKCDLIYSMKAGGYVISKVALSKEYQPYSPD